MKMYLKSQYHMDPPHQRAPDGALRQLYPCRVDATTHAPPSLLHRHRDVLIASRARRRRFTWGWPARRWTLRRPGSGRVGAFDHGPDDRKQCQAVLGDDVQKRM